MFIFPIRRLINNSFLLFGMDFKSELTKLIKKQVKGDFELTIPPSDMGDYALPCFPFAKELKKDPVQIANELKEKIKASFLEKIEVKGAYLNFYVDKKKYVKSILEKVNKEKDCYGSRKSKKEKVMVEFSQANTHKAFHVGHIRGTSLGEALARILEFVGKKVIRANYQGDVGMHVAKWIWCYNKYHKKDKLKDDEAWIASIYVDAVSRLSQNAKLQDEVDEVNRKLEDRSDKELNKIWKTTRKLSLESLEKIYKEMNPRFDHYFFEGDIYERAKEISASLVKKKIAEISDGATIINLEEYNMGIWVLLRKDGTVLYSAKDLALAEDKFKKYKVEESIYVVGKEQEQYLRQVFKTLEIMEFKQASKCKHVPVSLVKLPTGKMSSRTGQNILYSEFKNELVKYAKSEIKKREKVGKEELEKRAIAIAIATMKYSMLKQNPYKEIVFNKEEALNFEGDTGPYLLYTYARASSIMRKSTKKSKMEISELEEKEIELVKVIGEFPERVEKAANNFNPGVIANYSYKLAHTFNEFYANCKVIGEDNESFRLALIDTFRTTIRNSLNLLAINVIERM